VIANLTASVEQVRWHAQAALNGFETLDLETAAACAQSELRALILYLDALDNTDKTVSVFVKRGVKPEVVLEGIVGDGEGGD
jgi:hypothetical protein